MAWVARWGAAAPRCQQQERAPRSSTRRLFSTRHRTTTCLRRRRPSSALSISRYHPRSLQETPRPVRGIPRLRRLAFIGSPPPWRPVVGRIRHRLWNRRPRTLPPRFRARPPLFIAVFVSATEGTAAALDGINLAPRPLAPEKPLSPPRRPGDNEDIVMFETSRRYFSRQTVFASLRESYYY